MMSMSPFHLVRRPVHIVVAAAALAMLFTACGPKNGSDSNVSERSGEQAPKATPEPEAKPSPPPTKAEMLMIVPSRLTVDEAAGTVTLAPNTARRAATYTTWVFDLKSFRSVLGDGPKSPTRVVVTRLKTEKKRHKPGKGMASPDGGFQLRTITAKVLTIVPE